MSLLLCYDHLGFLFWRLKLPEAIGSTAPLSERGVGLGGDRFCEELASQRLKCVAVMSW